MSSLSMTRASYNHINPNMRVGKAPERAYVGNIGVFDAENNSLLFRVPFTVDRIHNIIAFNPELSPLDVAVKLATGVRVLCQYGSSTSGVSRRPVLLKGLK